MSLAPNLYGLFEEVHLENGRVLNPDFATYLLPTALDAPDIQVGLVEAADVTGPFGAKGLGELALDPVAATILAAIRDATGVMMTRIPVTPERMYDALRATTFGSVIGPSSPPEDPMCTPPLSVL